jgi:hypothetical protein
MLPLLRACDIDGALLAAMSRIDAGSVPPVEVAPSSQPTGASVVDIYPVDIGAGPVAEDGLKVLRGEGLIDHMFGPDPAPLDVVAVRNLAAATGHVLDDITMVDAWHRFPDGDVDLAGIQLPGADPAALADAMLTFGLEKMWHPEVEVRPIGGREVTIFHTEESLGRPNYLYISGDIAWMFVAPEQYVEAVLEHLPT